MSYYYHDVRVVVVEKDKPVSRRVSVLLKFENLFNEARLSVTPMKLFLYVTHITTKHPPVSLVAVRIIFN